MKKIYCICNLSKCDKYRKFKTLKYNKYIFEETLVLSIICGMWGSNDEKIFKEEESIEILKLFQLN